jgi:hypothetical protein
MSVAEHYAADAAEAARKGDFRSAALLYRTALLLLQAFEDEEIAIDGLVQDGSGGARWHGGAPGRSTSGRPDA